MPGRHTYGSLKARTLDTGPGHEPPCPGQGIRIRRLKRIFAGDTLVARPAALNTTRAEQFAFSRSSVRELLGDTATVRAHPGVVMTAIIRCWPLRVTPIIRKRLACERLDNLLE